LAERWHFAPRHIFPRRAPQGVMVRKTIYVLITADEIVNDHAAPSVDRDVVQLQLCLGSQVLDR
jgi:hypothetical protein